MICPKCKKELKINDAVVLTKGLNKWSAGDFSYICYESGEYVDIEDMNGGKRGKKGRFGVQRVNVKNLICFECGYPK